MSEIRTGGIMFCCGAGVIGRFGGGESYDSPGEGGDEYPVKELVRDIKANLKAMKRRGYSMVYATTMSNQPNASAALEEVGFYTAGPFKTCGYPDGRTMQPWFIPLAEVK